MPETTRLSKATASANPSSDDRRAAERFPTDLETSCRSLVGLRGDSWPARVKDVSTGGIALILGRRYEPGALLALDVDNPVQGFSMTLLARVIHVTAQDNGRWQLGCAFVSELGDEELKGCGAERIRPEEADCRAWVRSPCHVLCVCYQDGAVAPAPWPARVVNLSPSGLALEAGRAPEKGALLRLELAASGSEPLRVLVRVVQSHSQPDGSWLLGCEFAQKLSEDKCQVLGL